jgi:hypothetical protein
MILFTFHGYNFKVVGPHTTVSKVYASSFWPVKTIRYMFRFIHAMTKNNNKKTMMNIIIIIINLIILIISNYSIM